MTTRSGGITVFLAVICLILLAFVATIVDVTRYHIVIAQSERALYLSSQSILSYYDRRLKDQYGLFGLDINVVDIDEVMAKSLEGRKKHVSYQDFQIMSTGQFQDISIVQDQLLSFMAYRMPGILLEPVLEQLNLLSKTAKTQELLEEQKVVVERSEGILLDFENLRSAIDGFSIQKGQFMMRDHPTYVKQLITDNKQDDEEEIAQSDIGHLLKKSKLDMTTFFGDLYNKETVFLAQIAGLDQQLMHYHNKNEEILKAEALLLDLIEDEVADEETIYWQQVQIVRIKQSRDEVEASISEAVSQINQYRVFIDREVKAFIDKIFFDNNALSIKYKNQEALNLIKAIGQEAESLIADIQMFKLKIEGDSDNYIQEAYQGSLHQLEQLETELDMESLALSTHNNLSLMEEILEHNIVILNSAQLEVENLLHYCENLNLLQQQQITPLVSRVNALRIDTIKLYEPTEMDERMTRVINSEIIEALPTYETGIKEWVSQVGVFKDKLKAYHTGLYFDYSSMDVEIEDSFFSQISEGVEGLKEQLDITKLVGAYGLEDLSLDEERPSQRIGGNQTHLSGIDLNIFSGFGIQLNQIGEETWEQILLGEYAMGMFSTYVGATHEEALTLTRYDKSSHYLSGEIEYILSGKKNQQESVLSVISDIMLVRVLCNTIHIISNHEKRLMVNQLAQAIAGWWTAGVGAILIAGVIALLWAMLESFVDTAVLLRGERVAFIKTASSWYTGFSGGWQQLMAVGIEEAEKASIKMVDWMSTGLKTKIGDVTESIRQTSSDSLALWWEESVHQLVEEVIWTQEAQQDSFDNQIQAYLDSCIKNKLGGLELPQITSDEGRVTGGVEEALMKQMREVVREMLMTKGEVKQVSLVEAVSLKNDVLEQFAPAIDEIKANIVIEGKAMIETEIEKLTSVVQIEIENGIDHYTTLGKDALKGRLNEAKKKLMTRKNEVSNDMKLASFIPGLSYDDYCRMFLFAQQDKNLKILRMLDLIEANMRQVSGDPTYDILSLYTGIEIETEIQIVPLFVDFTENYWGTGSLYKRKVGAFFDY